MSSFNPLSRHLDHFFSPATQHIPDDVNPQHLAPHLDHLASCMTSDHTSLFQRMSAMGSRVFSSFESRENHLTLSNEEIAAKAKSRLDKFIGLCASIENYWNEKEKPKIIHILTEQGQRVRTTAPHQFVSFSFSASDEQIKHDKKRLQEICTIVTDTINSLKASNEAGKLKDLAVEIRSLENLKEFFTASIKEIDEGVNLIKGLIQEFEIRERRYHAEQALKTTEIFDTNIEVPDIAMIASARIDEKSTIQKLFRKIFHPANRKIASYSGSLPLDNEHIPQIIHQKIDTFILDVNRCFKEWDRKLKLLDDDLKQVQHREQSSKEKEHIIQHARLFFSPGFFNAEPNQDAEELEAAVKNLILQLDAVDKNILSKEEKEQLLIKLNNLKEIVEGKTNKLEDLQKKLKICELATVSLPRETLFGISTFSPKTAELNACELKEGSNAAEKTIVEAKKLWLSPLLIGQDNKTLSAVIGLNSHLFISDLPYMLDKWRAKGLELYDTFTSSLAISQAKEEFGKVIAYLQMIETEIQKPNSLASPFQSFLPMIRDWKAEFQGELDKL